jgi:hypothetical protein
VRVLMPVSKLNRVGTEWSFRKVNAADAEWSGTRVQVWSQASKFPASVCDFASAGTVSLAHVAVTAKIAV